MISHSAAFRGIQEKPGKSAQLVYLASIWPEMAGQPIREK